MGQRASGGPLRPRKRPSQSRSEETVAAIVEAAAQILEADGIAGFNTNAIAQRAGVSIGSLYQYFPNKDALTVALMQRESRRFRDDMAAALAIPDGTAALEHLIAVSVRQQLQRPELARLLDIEEGRPALREEVDDAGRTALVGAIVRHAVPGHADPDMLATDLFAIIRGMVDAAGERGERDVAGMERRLRAAVFGYLDRMGGVIQSCSSGTTR